MGGRGSSGAGAKTTGIPKLPALVGSEKQVKWAESIRSNVFDNLQNAEDQISRYYAKSAFTDKNKKMRDAESLAGFTKKDVQTVRKMMYETLKNVTSASQIIDKRNSIAPERIWNMVRDEHRSGAVTKAYEFARKKRR